MSPFPVLDTNSQLFQIIQNFLLFLTISKSFAVKYCSITIAILFEYITLLHLVALLLLYAVITLKDSIFLEKWDAFGHQSQIRELLTVA